MNQAMDGKGVMPLNKTESGASHENPATRANHLAAIGHFYGPSGMEWWPPAGSS
ncbi:hypothetical protein ACTXOR_05025 [Arthrobacter rhombi]|uniref:hypothetical protein n=1 Tax=Arthrobacter rhombi TaxID=71253 RepID=UPI003FD4A75D